MKQHEGGDDEATRLKRLTQSLLMKPPEVADELRIGRSTVYLLLASGQLPCLRIGKSLRVPSSDLLEWIAEQTQRGE